MCLPYIEIIDSRPKKVHSKRTALPFKKDLLVPLSPESHGFPPQQPPVGIITAIPSYQTRCSIPGNCKTSREEVSNSSCSVKCTGGHRRRRSSSASSSSSCRSLRDVRRKIRSLWERQEQDRYKMNAEKAQRRRMEMEMERDRKDVGELERMMRKEVDIERRDVERLEKRMYLEIDRLRSKEASTRCQRSQPRRPRRSSCDARS